MPWPRSGRAGTDRRSRSRCRPARRRRRRRFRRPHPTRRRRRRCPRRSTAGRRASRRRGARRPRPTRGRTIRPAWRRRPTARRSPRARAARRLGRGERGRLARAGGLAGEQAQRLAAHRRDVLPLHAHRRSDDDRGHDLLGNAGWQGRRGGPGEGQLGRLEALVGVPAALAPVDVLDQRVAVGRRARVEQVLQQVALGPRAAAGGRGVRLATGHGAGSAPRRRVARGTAQPRLGLVLVEVLDGEHRQAEAGERVGRGDARRAGRRHELAVGEHRRAAPLDQRGDDAGIGVANPGQCYSTCDAHMSMLRDARHGDTG